MIDEGTVAFGLAWAVAPAISVLRQRGFVEVEARCSRRLSPGEFFCEPIPDNGFQAAWVKVVASDKPPVY